MCFMLPCQTTGCLGCNQAKKGCEYTIGGSGRTSARACYISWRHMQDCTAQVDRGEAPTAERDLAFPSNRVPNWFVNQFRSLSRKTRPAPVAQQWQDAEDWETEVEETEVGMRPAGSKRAAVLHESAVLSLTKP